MKGRGNFFYIIILLMNGEKESSESQVLFPSPRITSSVPSFLISKQKWHTHTQMYIHTCHMHTDTCIHINCTTLKACQFKMSLELICLLAVLIPACDSSSPAFCIMCYSTYKLNKQGDNLQPWHTPFLIPNQSVVPCMVLTLASCPAGVLFLKKIFKFGFLLLDLMKHNMR